MICLKYDIFASLVASKAYLGRYFFVVVLLHHELLH